VNAIEEMIRIASQEKERIKIGTAVTGIEKGIEEIETAKDLLSMTLHSEEVRKVVMEQRWKRTRISRKNGEGTEFLANLNPIMLLV
jgi:hypothetical protein